MAEDKAMSGYKSQLKLTKMTREDALRYFKKYSDYRGPFDFAICAKEGSKIHGVIALNCDGKKFSLGHIWTDGNAHIGSLLYGAAWRVAKAMGYTETSL
jgi:hypothetical protein